MTMVKRDDVTIRQISDAKKLPGQPPDDSATDTEIVRSAETSVPGTGKAPTNLPGTPKC